MKTKDLIHEYITCMKVKEGEDFMPTKQEDFDNSIDLFDTLNTVTVTLSDTTNYVLGTGADEGKVLLTSDGLDLVNAGTDLPAFTLIPNDGTIDGNTGNVDPSVATANDAPVITIDSTVNFTEDAGAAIGDTVATFHTNDEDKRTVIITFMGHCLRYRLDKGRWEDIKNHKSLMLNTAKKVQNTYLNALDKTDDKKIRNYFAEKATDLWDDVRMKQEKTPTKDEIREYLKSIFGKEYSRKQKQLLDSI